MNITAKEAKQLANKHKQGFDKYVNILDRLVREASTDGYFMVKDNIVAETVEGERDVIKELSKHYEIMGFVFNYDKGIKSIMGVRSLRPCIRISWA